jgi:hypothetical protein
MRVTHQLPVHIEQGDAAEEAVGDAKSVGHQNSPETALETPSGVGGRRKMGRLSPSSQTAAQNRRGAPLALEEDRSIQGTCRPQTMRFLLRRAIARQVRTTRGAPALEGMKQKGPDAGR